MCFATADQVQKNCTNADCKEQKVKSRRTERRDISP